MAKLLIVVGLMGCGKTKFAREYAGRMGYEYIDFDGTYHAGGRAGNVEEFLSGIIGLLNDNKDKNFIVDSWFKWHRYWYEDEHDDTVGRLRRAVGHEVEFLYLFVPFEVAYDRYLGKHAAGGIIPEYRSTMRERQENLLKKVMEACDGAR